MERETGIEPATNSLEGCDSTTELLPLLPSALQQHQVLRFAQDLGGGLKRPPIASTFDRAAKAALYAKLLARLKSCPSQILWSR